MTLLLLLAAAQAQEEVCSAAYRNHELVADLDAVDAAFSSFDLDEARAQLSEAHRRLLCLDERVDPHGLARMARQLALAFFLDQDDEAMRRWAMLSKRLHLELPWHADMGEEHPFRMHFAEVQLPDLAGPEASLLPPKKGGLFWNGHFVDDVAAPMEMPALVQSADKKGQWLDAWWQDGSAWPEEVLGPAGSTPSAPRWLTEPATDPRHDEHAAKALFTEAVVTPEPEAEPKTYTEDEIAAAKQEDVAGAYRDPFEDARRRAIRREVFETTSTNEAGDTVTVKTEVVTYRRDRSGGEPITYEIYYYWLRDQEAWQPAAVDAGRAGGRYLGDWVDGKPPPNTSHSPLVWVSHAAAAAYCASYGATLPPPDAPAVHADLGWEWRLKAGEPVRVNARGKVQSADPSNVHDDTGFRCASP